MRLIDADALVDEAMERYCKNCDRRKGIKNGKYRIVYEIGDAPCRACGTGDMIDELEDAPTVDAVPVKRGKWEMGVCSVCGGHAPYWPMATTYYESDYCPNCGAKMCEEGEDDD